MYRCDRDSSYTMYTIRSEKSISFTPNTLFPSLLGHRLYHHLGDESKSSACYDCPIQMGKYRDTKHAVTDVVVIFYGTNVTPLKGLVVNCFLPFAFHVQLPISNWSTMAAVCVQQSADRCTTQGQKWIVSNWQSSRTLKATDLYIIFYNVLSLPRDRH